jgi:hypothetical protein
MIQESNLSKFKSEVQSSQVIMTSEEVLCVDFMFYDFVSQRCWVGTNCEHERAAQSTVFAAYIYCREEASYLSDAGP